jgi:NADPH-dependent 2,4-dienoyl-CoA reductase/sulfur reductase-like enzyme
VVIGGGLVGVELAEFLSERGRTVTVIEESPNLATEMALPRRWRALYALREHGVRLLSGAVVEAITDDGVLYLQHGEQQIAPADHVIIATGVAENRGLADALGGCGAAIHLIGDCRGVGYIEGAIMDAARVARAI